MTERDKKDRDKIVKSLREQGLKDSLSRLLNEEAGGGINFEALTMLHTYCEALGIVYKDMRDKLKRDSSSGASSTEMSEIKKMIKDASNCQYFIERLYKEDLEMRGVDINEDVRYIWCNRKDWDELVKAWCHYFKIRSYGIDRKDWD